MLYIVVCKESDCVLPEGTEYRWSALHFGTDLDRFQAYLEESELWDVNRGHGGYYRQTYGMTTPFPDSPGAPEDVLSRILILVEMKDLASIEAECRKALGR